ncbi:MAG: zf-HC2 domain-containing protein [Nitrospirae bacterium]|nr:zf-HC2 domain-containing protein [Nitrospirota bacterium]
MNGHEISEELVAFLDGALSVEDARRVEKHLERCPSCREILEDFRRTGQLLNRWTEIAPSPGFEPRVLTHIRASETRRPVSIGFGNLNRWFFGSPIRWSAVAAGIVLMAGAAYWIFPLSRNEDVLTEAEKDEMATHIDLYVDYGVISHLDTLKPMDATPPPQGDESSIINTA